MEEQEQKPRRESPYERELRKMRERYKRDSDKKLQALVKLYRKKEDEATKKILERNRRAGEHFKTCPALAFQVVSFTRSNRNLVAGA